MSKRTIWCARNAWDNIRSTSIPVMLFNTEPDIRKDCFDYVWKSTRVYGAMYDGAIDELDIAAFKRLFGFDLQPGECIEVRIEIKSDVWTSPELLK